MPPTNLDLISAMQGVANEDTFATRQTLYQAFLASTLLVPISNPENEIKVGEQLIVGEQDVEFIVTRDDEDQTVMFSFSDEESLKAWKPEGCNYITLGARNLFQMAVEMEVAGVVINIEGPVVGGELVSWELQALADGLMPTESDSDVPQVSIPPGTRLSFGAPATPPSDALLAALRSVFGDHPEITHGYLFDFQVGENETHLVAGVKFADALSDDKVHDIMDDVADKATGALADDEFIDLMVVGAEDSPPIELNDDMLIFERK
jgi:hypothetical protein